MSTPMKKPNPEYIHRVNQLANHCPYFELLSMTMVDAGPGYAEAEVTAENGKILAHGTSTLMLLPGKGLTSEPPLPAKFNE